MRLANSASRLKPSAISVCLSALTACSGALPECNDPGLKDSRWQALEDRVLQQTGGTEFLLVPTVEFTSDLGRKDLVRFCKTTTTFEMRPDLGDSASQATVETEWDIRANDATSETDFAFSYSVDLSPVVALQRNAEALLAGKEQGE